MAALDTLPTDPRKKPRYPGDPDADPSSAYATGQAVSAAGQRVVNTVQGLATAPVQTGIAAYQGAKNFVSGLEAPAVPQQRVDTTIGPPKAAAGGIATPPGTFKDVNAGSTATAVPATSLAGRPLGYGSTINGVRTFNDGSFGGPQTVADTQVGVLANRVGRADAGIGGGIGTAANNGATLDVSPGAITPTGTQPQGGPLLAAQNANATAQQNVASDIASIANRDPRSVLGSAARNAAVDANSVGGKRGDLQLQDALSSLYGTATKPLDTAANLGDIAVKDAGDQSRALLASNTELAKENIWKRPEDKEVNLADGSLGILGPDGRVRPALDASGKPVRPQIGKPPEDIASYNKLLGDRVSTILGMDPLTGLIPDPTDAKAPGRRPTAAEYRAADAAARATFTSGPAGGAAADGGIAATPAATAAPAKPSKSQFIQAARAHNPNATQADLEKYYDKTYGG